MHRFGPRIASFALSGALLWSTPALAQDGDGDGPDAAADHKACFELRDYPACFREGKAMFTSDDFEASRKAYLEGWRLKQNYEIAGNLGNVSMRLERWREAYAYLHWANENLPPSAVDKYRPVIEGKMKEALAHVGAVNLRVVDENDGALRGARILVDDEPLTYDGARIITPTEFPVVLEPGQHVIRVAKEGYESAKYDVVSKPGLEETVALKLLPDLTGDDDDDDDVPVVAEGPSIPIVVTGAVLGAGALGAGIGLFVVAGQKASEREDLSAPLSDGECASGSNNPDCDQIADLSDQESTFQTAGTALLIGGGVISVATILYAVWPRGGGEASTEAGLHDLEWTPIVSPGYSGMALTGRF